MSMRPQSAPTRVLLAIMPIALGACVASKPITEPPRQFAPIALQPGDGRSIISRSALDATNRYLSTVMLMTPGRGKCSGVVVAPRVVLTAGHCVCTPRKAVPPESPEYTIIDRTTCAHDTSVFVVEYGPEDPPLGKRRTHTGTVQPHERLTILYNSQGKEVLSNSDLAVIFLDDALNGVKPVRIADKQPEVQDAVILVGYGQEDSEHETGAKRRIGTNEIATVEQSGATFLVGKPITIRNPYIAKEPLLEREEASYSLAGDSGGPCFRERAGTLELVGIAKTVYGTDRLVEFSEYTSTYAFKGWLREALKKSQADRD